jgi:hypothetical protein
MYTSSFVSRHIHTHSLNKSNNLLREYFNHTLKYDLIVGSYDLKLNIKETLLFNILNMVNLLECVLSVLS